MSKPKPGVRDKISELFNPNKTPDVPTPRNHLPKIIRVAGIIQAVALLCLVTISCGSSIPTNPAGAAVQVTNPGNPTPNTTILTTKIDKTLLPASPGPVISKSSSPTTLATTAVPNYPSAAVTTAKVPSHTATTLVAAKTSGQLPPPRANASLAYDNINQTVLLFGGVGAAPQGDLNDTWKWDGTGWNNLHPANAPEARNTASIASSPNQVVLFGGVTKNGGAAGDTWTWDGKNWLQQHPTISPSARVGAAMVYDPLHWVILLFGGDDSTRKWPNPRKDTWVWDGENWSEKHPPNSPAPHTGATMVYDPVSQTIILFGGADLPLRETWSWDGRNWTELHPVNSPEVSQNASSAYDESKHQPILFGGVGNNDGFDETWTWNGTNWLRLNPATSPAATDSPYSLVYDKARHNLVLFVRSKGKQMSNIQTWSWDGLDWVRLL